MSRLRPVRLLSSVAVAAASLLVWAAVRAAIDDLQVVDPPSDVVDWSQMTVFDVRPVNAADEQGIEERVKRWAAGHVSLIDLAALFIGTALALSELRKVFIETPLAGHGGKWNLAEPLIRWSRDAVWNIQDSMSHTLITGSSGSGKTSGSARTIALAAMKAGYGALVLLAKDDRSWWESLAKEAGRERDLLCFGRNELRFNFLDYELNRAGDGAGLTENLVKLFTTLMEMSERSSGEGGREDGPFWARTCRQLFRNLVDLVAFSTGKISVPELHRLVVSAPNSESETKSEHWRADSYCFQCLREADGKPLSSGQRQDLDVVTKYFLLEFPKLSDRTRSTIVSTFTSLVDILGRGMLRDLFCEETNVTPEVVENGAILLIALPIKQYQEIGVIAQGIWKYAFQIAIERRDISKSPRPVMLFADEAQFTVTSYDMQFLSTCRSSRVATVFATQNISNFYAALGGEQKGKAEADSIFGNLNTKIFHANGDLITNEWASKLVGRTRQFYMNASSAPQTHWVADLMGTGGAHGGNTGVSEHLELEIEPSVFSTFRTGGPENQWTVDALVFQSGKNFADTGRPWRFATFDQRS